MSNIKQGQDRSAKDIKMPSECDGYQAKHANATCTKCMLNIFSGLLVGWWRLTDGSSTFSQFSASCMLDSFGQLHTYTDLLKSSYSSLNSAMEAFCLGLEEGWIFKVSTVENLKREGFVPFLWLQGRERYVPLRAYFDQRTGALQFLDQIYEFKLIGVAGGDMRRDPARVLLRESGFGVNDTLPVPAIQMSSP